MLDKVYKDKDKDKSINICDNFKFKIFISKKILRNLQIFNFYFINKIKDINTNKAYEKSYLVIYNVLNSQSRPDQVLLLVWLG